MREIAVDKVVVQPGTTMRIPIPDETEITSYLVESAVPITAAWAASDSRGTAFIAGVAIDD